jgi:hypothetical protein
MLLSEGALDYLLISEEISVSLELISYTILIEKSLIKIESIAFFYSEVASSYLKSQISF